MFMDMFQGNTKKKTLLWSNHKVVPLYSTFSFSSPRKLHSFSSSRKSCGFFVCLFILFFEIFSLYCSLKSLPLWSPIFSRGGLRQTLEIVCLLYSPFIHFLHFFLLLFLLVPTQPLWSQFSWDLRMKNNPWHMTSSYVFINTLASS